MNADSSKAKVGSNLVVAGISLQLLWFIFFIILAALFHYRMSLRPTKIVRDAPKIQWQRYLGSLYFLSIMVVVRSGFRLAEYAEGFDGYLQGHEVFFYVFDSVPMFAVMVWMNWHHPGELSLLLRRGDSERSDRTAEELV
jgi:hypothetical protein